MIRPAAWEVAFSCFCRCAPEWFDTLPAPFPAAVPVRLEGVSKRYGDVLAVDDLSLDIPGGAFVTLLGPSGCGKSTTLSLIAGLERADTGRILLGDRDVTATPPNERGIAFVFQNYALYPHMDTFDNIAFNLRLRREQPSRIRERVAAVADLLGIGALLDRMPAELSGGQQQRVALGRALVRQPVAFLLDEPFSNLDAILRARMRTEIKRLHLHLGSTSIFVTHDQEEALVLSDLIAVMRDGKVMQYASQSEIYNRPANTYVATFVGKPPMSLVDATLQWEDGTATVVGAGLRCDLGSPDLHPGFDGPGPVTLGLRAENVQVLRGAEADAHGEGEVALLESVGSDMFVELTCGGQRIVARTRPDHALAIGDVVGVRVDPAAVHLFARESGERIAR
jgi:multiple sugar transport system ATP-binding protein